jgi:hypothetical protein
MKAAIGLLLIAIAASQALDAASVRTIPPEFGPQRDLIHNPQCGYLKDALVALVCDGLEN